MWADLRLAWRSLQRSPAFTLTAILTLAVGMGSTTAIFGIVNAVLLRPLPYVEPDRLVRVWESHPDNTRDLVSAANFSDWRARARTFSDLALFSSGTEPVVLGITDLSVQARQTAVSPNLFGMLGVRPASGREAGLASEPRGPLAGVEIVLSHAFWQQAFDADPAILDSPVRIEGAPGSIVVGVMPPGFSFPGGTDFWVAMDLTRAAGDQRDTRIHGAIGRLAPHVRVATARAELQAIASALAREHPSSNARWSVAVQPLHDSIVGEHRLPLVMLFAAVAFLMLVGCANVSNLLLARGMARRGELAVLAALGATRARIARLLLAETILLALVGGLAGMAFAGVLLPLLVALAGENVPRLEDARVSPAALACTAAAALVAAVVTGLVPAVRYSRTEVHTALGAEGGRSTRPRPDIRLQRAIVAGELAICLVLVAGAMLFTQTFVRLNAVDLGFDPEHVISIDARVPIYRTLAPNRWQLLASETTASLERLRAVPGVRAASATSSLPLAGDLLTADIMLAGESHHRRALYHRVSPGYFRTMGMTLVRGRDFTDEDASDLSRLPDPRAAIPRHGAVIVNETAARTFWPSGEAIGQSLSTGFDARAISRREVVGIVRDVRSETLRGAPTAEVYVPYLEDPGFALTIVVRSALPAARLVPVLRRELREVSPDMSTANVRLLGDIVGDSLRAPRFSALILAAFAVTALLLAALGVFGVFAFGTAGRVREVGIRLALGATRADIRRMFLRQAVGPILGGVTLGTLGALGLGGLVRALLFGIQPTDVRIYAVAVPLVVAVALAASYLPVRRVLRTDPARALRA